MRRPSTHDRSTCSIGWPRPRSVASDIDPTSSASRTSDPASEDTTNGRPPAAVARSARHGGKGNAGKLVAAVLGEGGKRLTELSLDRLALAIGEPSNHDRERAGRVKREAHVVVNIAEGEARRYLLDSYVGEAGALEQRPRALLAPHAEHPGSPGLGRRHVPALHEHPAADRGPRIALGGTPDRQRQAAART